MTTKEASKLVLDIGSKLVTFSVRLSGSLDQDLHELDSKKDLKGELESRKGFKRRASWI
jgi:hypothetical protein